MPRVRGWLKADALADGVDEQYAVEKDGVLHTVTLDRQKFGGYVVTVTTGVEWTRTEFADHLWQARNEFRRVVRSLGGRA